MDTSATVPGEGPVQTQVHHTQVQTYVHRRQTGEAEVGTYVTMPLSPLLFPASLLSLPLF